jgi:hypothetical protein
VTSPRTTDAAFALAAAHVSSTPTNPGDRLIEIRFGTLDDAPSDLRPEAEIWVKRRETWIPPVEGAAQYDENRG